MSVDKRQPCTAACLPLPLPPPLQTEVSQLKGDRERIRGSAVAAQARADELAQELEAAKQVGWSMT